MEESAGSNESISSPPATNRHQLDTGDSAQSVERNAVVFVNGPPDAMKRKRADVWDHYDVVFVEEGNPKKTIQKGRCKHCNTLIAAESKNGTSGLRNHAKRHGNCSGEPHGNACKKVMMVKPKINGGLTILNYFRPDSI
ncbi:hypothetical protein LINPERHAP2_LOCUS6616 [Linum perenne]